LPVALAEDFVAEGDGQGHEGWMVGIEAEGCAGPVADGLDGDAIVLIPGDSQVIAGHDAVPGADALGGGMEGDVEEIDADGRGVEEDEGEEGVVEAAVEH